MWLRFGLGAAVAALGWLIPSVVSAAGLSVTSQFSGPTPLQGVAFVDAQTGWAVGGTCAPGNCSGMVLSTVDGGAHWLPQASALSAALTDVSFVDATHGWAAGEACADSSCASPRGAVLGTSDGGAHWSAQVVGDVPPLSDIHFVDAAHGWAVGTSPGVLLSTDDGGATWRATTPSQATGLSKVTATDPNHAWALADGSVYALGADGSWTGHPVGGQALRGLTFVDPRHGWVIDGDGQVYGTADGGSTWSPQGTVSSAVTGVGFGDPLHGLAVGPSTMSDSVDGGKTWSNVDPGVSSLGDLAAVATPDASHWWAVGHDGSIYAAAFPDAAGSGWRWWR